MRRKTLLLAAVLILTFQSSAYEFTEDVKLNFGEERELGDLRLSYEKLSGSQNRYLMIGVERGDSILVLDTLYEDSLYGQESWSKDYPQHNFSLVYSGLKWDGNKQYADLTVSTDRNFFSDADLSTDAPDRLIVSQGESTTVPLKLENTGVSNQTFRFSAETNSSLETSYSFGDFNVSKLFVETGSSKSIEARIEVPEAQSPGIYTVEMIVENRSRASEKVRIDVRGTEAERDMELDIEQMYHEVLRGKQVEIRANARNLGDAPLEEVNVTASGPSGWDVTVENGYFEEVEGRYGLQSTIVNVEPPQDVSPGDYIVEVAANSKNTEVEPQEVRVNVREKSGLSYIGAGLMVFSLLILVFVYRKFQRR